MSTSPWLIRPPSAEQQTQAQTVKPKTAAARGQGNFASLLASQSKGMAETDASMPNRNLILAGRSPSDMLRMQMFNKAQSDLSQTRALSGLAQATSGSTLELARSMGQARHIRAIAGREGHLSAALGSAALGDFIHACPTRKRSARKKGLTPAHQSTKGLGVLSAQFESGKDGIAAVGYDGTGGTSYGKFQIASKVGTMKDFLQFLDTEAPDIAKKLRNSGPANTGSRKGAMPDMWRAIAASEPERFEDLQEAFARESHYQPALNSILQKTGLEEETLSPAMREVIWSTAIQHGPSGASRIFARADSMSGNPDDPNYERKMINNVYQIRATQFGSSTESVRAAVQTRFKKEKVLALNMLGTAGDGVA